MSYTGSVLATSDPNEARYPLRHQHEHCDEEEKTLNNNLTLTFPRNIRGEENEYPASEDHSYNDRDNARSSLYHYQQKTLYIFIGVAVVISLLSIGLSTYAVVKYNDAAKELQIARENQGKVCLPCDDQTIQLDSWKQRNAAGDCCVKVENIVEQVHKIAAQKAEQRVKLAEDAMLAKYESASTGNSSAARRVSAHLAYSGRSRSWSSEGNHAHITDGLSMHSSPRGSLLINQTGYYFIYSQMTMLVHNSLTMPTFKHEISKKNTVHSTANQTLLRSDNMRWKPAVDRSYLQQTSFVAGVMYLQSDNVIFSYNHDRKDAFDQCTTNECFFGLYKL